MSMKAKISPNQSGWPSTADMRTNGKVAHHEKPMRKYQNLFFTRSIRPTLTVRPASSTSRLGSTLNT